MESFKLFWESNINVRPIEVLRMIHHEENYRNLYPGWGEQEDNIYETDYYFNSKEQAFDYAEQIIDFFEGFPNEINKYLWTTGILRLGRF